jgi:TRAP transporter TAXI family solute receptor
MRPFFRAITAAGWVAATLAAAALIAGAGAQELKFFRIGTGSTAGTYFPVGSLIASVISNPPGSRACEDGGSCGVPGLIAAAQATAGSVANIAALADGSLESALAQADIVHWAYAAQGIYSDKQPVTSLRAIANLYPESFHLVVRKGLQVDSVADLRGKRVSLDTKGAGTQVDAYLILEAYGLGDKDLHPVFANPGLAMELILQDRIDAFFFISGAPARAITELAADGAIDLVPISGPEARSLRERHGFFAEDLIPAGTYAGSRDIETLSVGAQWVVSETVPEELVYQITKALWHPNNRKLLEGGHAKAKLIRPRTALSGISIPLHPGAERYYREADMLK